MCALWLDVVVMMMMMVIDIVIEAIHRKFTASSNITRSHGTSGIVVVNMVNIIAFLTKGTACSCSGAAVNAVAVQPRELVVMGTATSLAHNRSGSGGARVASRLITAHSPSSSSSDSSTIDSDSVGIVVILVRLGTVDDDFVSICHHSLI